MPDHPPPSVPGFAHSGDQAPPEKQTNNLNKTNPEFYIELNMTGQVNDTATKETASQRKMRTSLLDIRNLISQAWLAA
jgi:hypothetical protein